MSTGPAPLVSVLVAVHNGARYLRAALDSALRQTCGDLELVVVEDASTDETPTLLRDVSDPRLVVVTNDEQLGLAASLNRGLEVARGRYLARLDADDVAFPEWIDRLLARIRSEPAVAVAGSAMLDSDAGGRAGALHRMPRGALAVRWHALFSAPFFHSTVLVDREVLDRHGLRYDPSYLESEDYDLWARLLAHAEGANVDEPLVLHRVHGEQASARRRDLQVSLQRQVALREIARLAPELETADVDVAWRLGSRRGVPDGSLERGARVYVSLLARFEERHGADASVRDVAARTLARAGLVRRALALSPGVPVRFARERAQRSVQERSVRRRAAAWLAELRQPAGPIRVAVVSPEPTPYRSPLFDRIARRPEVELTVVYAARTVAGRTWSVEPRHRSVFLRGAALPGMRSVFRHDYPVTPGIVRALRAERPDVVVVSGWSTFASQAAIAWCRAHHVPYVLLVESHDLDPRPRWRRAVKDGVVPRIVRAAASTLVVGSAARDSVVARGAASKRSRVFTNTVDVPAWAERADRLAEKRPELRQALGAAPEDVVVLSVGRLVRDKGIDILVRALAETGDRSHLLLAVAGSGPERKRLTELARELGARLNLVGELPWEHLAEAYVAADVFALLSSHEPWGVVVNEAAACGLPLVLSDRVGAAHDLLRAGENGMLVSAGDVTSVAAALRRLADDPGERRRLGARSRELVREWGYEPSVESFVAAVREAAAR